LISLDQVRLLEQKVENAVNKILQLQKENAELREKCAFFESKANNLNQRVSDFEADQNKIEEGIENVLKRLNIVEDAVKNTIEPVSNKSTEESTVFVDPISETVDSTPLNSDSYFTEAPELEDMISEETEIESSVEETDFNPQEEIDIPTPSNSFDFDEAVSESETTNIPVSNQFDIF